MIDYIEKFREWKVVNATNMWKAISSTIIKPGGFFSKTFTVKISTWNHRQLDVLTFVNKVGNTGTTHEVMNVQSTKLGTNKNFD